MYHLYHYFNVIVVLLIITRLDSALTGSESRDIRQDYDEEYDSDVEKVSVSLPELVYLSVSPLGSPP